MKKRQYLCYLVFMIGLCVIPFAGMLWKEEDSSSENRTLASMPVVKDENGWNIDFLSDMGTYFEDHFAYRQEMVTADSLIRGNVFGVSAADGVIEGTDGWLYYKDSLDDYLGRDVLSDRAVYNIAHTVKMMQDYVERNGRNFLFLVAPNKNSLYDEYMPYYYSVKVSDTSNIDKLIPQLEQEGVNFVDLYQVFESQDEILYHKRDSHWDNRGAALAAETILDAIGLEHRSYGEAEYEVRTDYAGDLDKMLYPDALTLEQEYYYTVPFEYEYTGEVESNFDPEIKTTNDAKTGSLLMYRDSFGNALLPFMAEEFGEARFSRGVPYYLDDMIFCNADTVIVERAERFLPDMGQNPPVAQAPLAILEYDSASEWEENGTNAANCQTSEEGLYLKFSGTIDEKMVQTESQIYLRIDGEYTYEAFPVSIDTGETVSDYGYAVYIEKENLEDEEGKIELFVTTDQGTEKVFQDIVSYDIQIYE